MSTQEESWAAAFKQANPEIDFRTATIGHPQGYPALSDEKHGILANDLANTKSEITRLAMKLPAAEREAFFERENCDAISVAAIRQAMKAELERLEKICASAVKHQAHLHRMTQGDFDKAQLKNSVLYSIGWELSRQPQR